MYQTNHIVLVDRDEIIAATTDDAKYAPLIQLYNSGLIGGPVTLQFGNASDPQEGLRILDRFLEAIQSVRLDLLKRAVAAPATNPNTCPFHGSTCRRVWHKNDLTANPGWWTPDLG